MPTDFNLEQLIPAHLDELRAAHLYRQRRLVTPLSATHIEIEGRRLVNYASNDYLGLSHHQRVMAAANRAIATAGAGSGAAPLVSGYTAIHAHAEAAVARWKDVEDAVLFPSGYQANLAAVQTLAALAQQHGGKGRFLLDKLAHASLVDAVRGSGLEFRVFPHNGMDKLARLLSEADDDQMQIVVTESIFSMDGDCADLPWLARLKKQYGFVLLLDEAHGSGVYGQAGAGYASELSLGHCADLEVVTFSKAVGCAGGAICGTRNVCGAVVNLARAYIFSTSIAPSIPAAVIEAIAVMRDEPQRQTRVRQLAAEVRHALGAAGCDVSGADAPIIPIILGSQERAMQASQYAWEQGMLIPAIRPPTVARGSSRLRVTLCSQHSDQEIAALVQTLKAICR